MAAKKTGEKLGGEPKWHPDAVNGTGGDPWATDNNGAGETMAGGACKKNTETFTEEPFSIYVRVYLKRQGRWQQVNIIAHNVHMQAAFCEFPTDPQSPQIPIDRGSYPLSRQRRRASERTSAFVIKDVVLPQGWQPVFMQPQIGETFVLEPNQRELSSSRINGSSMRLS
jgi:hypothetical protein